MRKRQSHWPALTYYRPCKSIRENADYVINNHEPSSSLILSAFYIVISSRIHIFRTYLILGASKLFDI